MWTFVFLAVPTDTGVFLFCRYCSVINTVIVPFYIKGSHFAPHLSINDGEIEDTNFFNFAVWTVMDVVLL